MRMYRTAKKDSGRVQYPPYAVMVCAQAGQFTLQRMSYGLLKSETLGCLCQQSTRQPVPPEQWWIQTR